MLPEKNLRFRQQEGGLGPCPFALSLSKGSARTTGLRLSRFARQRCFDVGLSGGNRQQPVFIDQHLD